MSHVWLLEASIAIKCQEGQNGRSTVIHQGALVLTVNPKGNLPWGDVVSQFMHPRLREPQTTNRCEIHWDI